jgi:malate dehydrogenase
MLTVVILGAGEHGATLARRLAGRELARRIVLVDPDEGKARGKALDILQSGPVDRFDTRVDGGASDAGAIGEPDILVVADAPELTDGPGAADRLAQLVAKAKPRLVVVSGARPAASIDGLLGAGFAADRIAGSAPVAVASAIRRRLAAALDVEASAVCLALLGLPPDVIVVPHASAAAGGVPIEQLRPAALRQAVQEVGGRTPGPVALAAAAVHVIAALVSPRPSVLPVLARGDAAFGLGRATIALPRRLGGWRVGETLEVALEPYERVALENAAEGRFHAAGRTGSRRHFD